MLAFEIPISNGILGCVLIGHFRHGISSITAKASKQLYEDINRAFKVVQASVPETVKIHYTAQPFGPGGVDAGESQGGNAMGLKKVLQDCESTLHLISKFLSASVSLPAPEQGRS